MVQQVPPDVVQNSFDLFHPVEESRAPICVPEPMDLSDTPPDMSTILQEQEDMHQLIPPQPPTIGSLAGLNQQQPVVSSQSASSQRSPGKRRDKEKESRDKEPTRKKSRKDSDREDSGRSRKDSSRSRKEKGKEPHRRRSTEEAEPTGDVTVVAEVPRPTLREAAKSMPRIPKLSQRSEPAGGRGAPPSSGAGVSDSALMSGFSRDPRMLKQVGECQPFSKTSFFSLSLLFPPDPQLLIHPGEDSFGGGGGGGTTNNEDDVQVVADYATRSPGRRSSRAHNNNNKKASPGHSQGS